MPTRAAMTAATSPTMRSRSSPPRLIPPEIDENLPAEEPLINCRFRDSRGTLATFGHCQFAFSDKRCAPDSRARYAWR